MSRGIQQATCVPNFKNLSWFMRPWLQKYVWPTFGCILGQIDPIVMQLKLDMSCHLLNVYTKFQIDISKHVEEKSGKRGRTNGRTDGRTLPRHNTSRFSNERIKTNNNFGQYYNSPNINYSSNIRPLNSFDSSPPGVAYMRQWIGSASVQIMACRRSGAKPLPQPALNYCQLDP